MKHNRCITYKLCNGEFHVVCIGLSRNDIPNIDVDIWSCMGCNENLYSFNSLIEDDEFIGVNNNNQINIQKLNSMLFQPFYLSENDNSDLLNDVNPDENYFNNFMQLFGNGSQYYDGNTFIEEGDQNSMSLLHLNIRSCNKNLSQLTL